MSIPPFKSPKLALEKYAKIFIQEEDNLGDTINLPKEEGPARSSVELKPLPVGLCYAFLNSDTKTPVIISNKLTDEETAKRIAILE